MDAPFSSSERESCELAATACTRRWSCSLVGSADGIQHIVESHELTLFGDDDYRAAFDRAGLAVEVVASPHPDRDRYIGHRGE